MSCKNITKSICKKCVGRWTEKHEKYWKSGNIFEICPKNSKLNEILCGGPSGLCYSHFDKNDSSCKVCLIRIRCIEETESRGNNQEVEEVSCLKDIPSWCPFRTEHVVAMKK
jgi:hypothetical protein